MDSEGCDRRIATGELVGHGSEWKRKHPLTTGLFAHETGLFVDAAWFLRSSRKETKTASFRRAWFVTRSQRARVEKRFPYVVAVTLVKRTYGFAAKATN